MGGHLERREKGKCVVPVIGYMKSDWREGMASKEREARVMRGK